MKLTELKNIILDGNTIQFIVKNHRKFSLIQKIAAITYYILSTIIIGLGIASIALLAKEPTFLKNFNGIIKLTEKTSKLNVLDVFFLLNNKLLHHTHCISYITICLVIFKRIMIKPFIFDIKDKKDKKSDYTI